MKARIAGITSESVSDGPGLRLTVFFQGCPHGCPSCHNPETWQMQGGQEVDIEPWVDELPITPLLSGLTFSGGEPFAQAEAAACIANTLNSRLPRLWVYTGYTWEALMNRKDQPGVAELLHLAEVVVDGPFRLAERDLNLPFRGSRNQRIILVKPSMESGQIVHWQEAVF